MNLGTSDRGMTAEVATVDILKMVFPDDEKLLIERVVRTERNRELVNELFQQARARGDAPAQAALAELRINLRAELADANRCFVAGDCSGAVAMAEPQPAKASFAARLKGVLAWIR